MVPEGREARERKLRACALRVLLPRREGLRTSEVSLSR